jgi:hypothetical protein
MTGVPLAIASIMTSPKGSGQSIGKGSAIARPRNSPLSRSPISPMDSTPGPFRFFDLVIVIIKIGFVDLGRDFQRYSHAVGYFDRLFHPLFGLIWPIKAR